MARTGEYWIVEDGVLKAVKPDGYDVLVRGIDRYVNFNSISGSSGYGIRDNSGTLEFKNQSGAWTTFGSGGGGGSTIFVDSTEVSDPDFLSTGDIDFIATGSDVTANINADTVGLTELSATGTPSSSTFLRGDNTWATPAGSGDVTGPGSSVNDNIVLFDGTSGTQIKDSGSSISDFAAASHTHTASDVTDFDTEVSNNTDVAANTSARHSALTVTDSAEIDFTLTGQDLTASLIAGSIDETKLDTSVNASLDLADSAAQPADLHSAVTLAGTPNYLTLSGQEITLAQIDLATDVTGDLPVADGGTGASTASVARTNLGLGTAATEDTGTASGDIALLTTGGVFADGRISESSVTQHEAALALTESQISDLGNYAVFGHTHTESDITDLGNYLESVGIADINATGTPSSTTYLRGDGTWATPPGDGSGGDTSNNIVSAPQFFNPDATGVTNDTDDFTVGSENPIAFVTVNGQVIDDSEYSLSGTTLTVTPDNGFDSTSDEVLVFQNNPTELFNTTEEIQDDAWSVLTGTQTLITVTYDDVNNEVDFVVENDLSQYDNTTSGFITGYTVTEADVTTHQAALSITESQISDLGTYLESVGITDINATGTADGTTFLRGDGTWATPAGGSGSPAGTDGAVQFNSSSSFGADNANFFWDDTNDRLGIGTATPAEALDVSGNINATGTLSASNTDVNGFSAKNSTTSFQGSSWTTAVFSNTMNDTDSNFDGSIYTVPSDGLYRINGVFTFQSVIDGNRYIVGLGINATNNISYILGRGVSGGTNLAGVGGSLQIPLTAGDEVRLLVWCGNSTQGFSSDGYQSFSIYKITGQ